MARKRKRKHLLDETLTMKTITWAPFTNQEMDKLFDELREIQYKDKTHRLWANYNKDFLNYCVALTMCFENDQPIACSSISIRDCWPKNCYRILNRTWKPYERLKFPRKLSMSIVESAKNQISWLKANTNMKIVFISRQTTNWDDWLMSNLNSHNLNFTKDRHLYLTCPNTNDDSCWQKIIYQGDEKILLNWNRKVI